MFRRSVLLVALGLFSSVLVSAPGGSRAEAQTPEFWPSCADPSSTRCVESLYLSTGNGSFPVAEPGYPVGVPETDPYVQVMGTTMQSPTGPVSIFNFSVVSPLDPVLGPGVYNGLSDGLYTFTLRLGSLDPSFTAIAGDPVSITPSVRGDGSFAITISARPKPLVSVMNSVDLCVAGGWTCQGEVGVQRNISGFVTTSPAAELRPLLRGAWVATNASFFTTPQVSLAERKISASAAGPHTVPAGYPLTGLTLEGGQGLNPAFYKAFFPFALLEAMLARAPEELRSSLSPETVKARVSEIGGQREQPVSVSISDLGVLVDLNLVHFSAPNPEIVFAAPTGSPGISTPVTPPVAPPDQKPSVKVGQRFSPSKYVKIPKGFKVVKVAVRASSKRVCAVSGKRIVANRKGTCRFTVQVAKEKLRRSLSGYVLVT